MEETERLRTILLFGAPGSGKGTQGKVLGQVPGFFHLSCGEIFRALDVHQNLGKLVYDHLSRGELVPDDITIRLWRENLHAQSVLGYYKPYRDLLVLDGIPRNRHQAQLMDKHIDVLQVIHLTCTNEEEMIHRMRKRALKENRHDDTQPEVIRKRMALYHDETRPVLEHYSDERIANIDANQSPAEVLEQILRVLIPIQNEHYGNVMAAG